MTASVRRAVRLEHRLTQPNASLADLESAVPGHPYDLFEAWLADAFAAWWQGTAPVRGSGLSSLVSGCSSV